MSTLFPVILSGGSGTRLWPLSRETYPKQFLPLLGQHSLLQSTWLRVAHLSPCHGPILVANEWHRFIAAEQMQQIGVDPLAILLEPEGRNTAPAIAVACLEALRHCPDPLVLIMPSDHVIAPIAAFESAVHHAIDAARQDRLVTFGIEPTSAEIGYGYINATGTSTTRPITRFIEKPDRATAQRYFESGEYLWNSGMFLFRAKRYIEELTKWQPQMARASTQAWENASADRDFIRLESASFCSCPAESIDYAVMEKTQAACVVMLSAQWNDVGSWSALQHLSPSDADGNASQGDVICLDCRNSYAYASRLTALIGLDDIIVVDTDDAILVGHRSRMQDVKDIVKHLKDKGRLEATWHRKVYRPWGAYDAIDKGERFLVKRITVKPGATLSLQMHHHRAEHWIIVKGTAEVTRGDEVILLSENQSTYIPLGIRHRLRNPGKLPLELIEVQSGSYLAEDDIVRFEDSYGRT